ncbi:hypothetical protein ACWGF3_15950, partial [Streptomyces xanthophaeus]
VKPRAPGAALWCGVFSLSRLGLPPARRRRGSGALVAGAHLIRDQLGFVYTLQAEDVRRTGPALRTWIFFIRTPPSPVGDADALILARAAIVSPEGRQTLST